MESGETIWRLAAAAFVVWRAVGFLNVHLGQVAAHRLPDAATGSHPSGAYQMPHLASRFFDAVACILLWLWSQASVLVLGGSAAMILVGLFVASARHIQKQFVLQSRLEEDASSYRKLDYPMFRLCGCQLWRMRDEGYL